MGPLGVQPSPGPGRSGAVAEGKVAPQGWIASPSSSRVGDALLPAAITAFLRYSLRGSPSMNSWQHAAAERTQQQTAQ
jgi:hypothetical protein